MRKPSLQPTKLLPCLFETVDEELPLTVFHIGPALPDTIDFFSSFRCKLHFIDLFSELPVNHQHDGEPTIAAQFAAMLKFPADTRFDICLFWDVFNYLDREAISAFLTTLRPHLKDTSLAHAFSVHNRNAVQGDHLYGISQRDAISFRSRRTALPGYAPHSQSELKTLLHCFTVARSVLLPDSRLELLLHARL
ncbi:MAG: hypothetical protein R3E50_00075 [Halioglobus sp.]